MILVILVLPKVNVHTKFGAEIFVARTQCKNPDNTCFSFGRHFRPVPESRLQSTERKRVTEQSISKFYENFH